MTTPTASAPGQRPARHSHRKAFSLDHAGLLDTLATRDDLLLIQDLDGVCMGLVGDPLTRTLERRYLDAAHLLAGRFYVLTNGEHIGSRGVNGIVEATLDSGQARGHYLPGLAAGGVQWQDRSGQVSHPGVDDAELAFLKAFPSQAEDFLDACLQHPPYSLELSVRRTLIASAILDNLASPTLNLNVFHRHWQHQPERYRALQQAAGEFLHSRCEAAAGAGLTDSFFVHYAPNGGHDDAGRERLLPASGDHAGTTDFQLMLRGAVKEAGVLAILNRYYHDRTGTYPLGEAFNAREAPRDLEALTALARERFDPAQMPMIVGIGDTVTSFVSSEGKSHQRRGGSDRGFLTLVQRLGEAFDSDNRVLYVDSSGGEVRRAGVDAKRLARYAQDEKLDVWPGLEGISDIDDPLTLDVIFPDGHTQYVDFFCKLAARRTGSTPRR